MDIKIYFIWCTVNWYYNLIVTDYNGCEISDSVFVGTLSNIGELETRFIDIYPIPSNGEIFLNNTTTGFFNARIFDISGRLIESSISVQPNEKSIIHLPIGHFLIEIRQEYSSYFQKIIILE